MNVLITAGGTSEAIDAVRSITNYSTGRLGSIIADYLGSKNAAITYVCGESAVLPSSNNADIIRIRNAQGLSHTISGLLAARQFDCVIHSMAVSDFTPQAALTLDDIVASAASAVESSVFAGLAHNLPSPAWDEGSLESLAQARNEGLSAIIRAAILSSAKPLDGEKISSKNQDLMILLKQTPKVIKLIKAKQPKTILVGFKLLSGVSEGDLLQVANNLLTQAPCDFVLANDLQNINGDTHKAILLDKAGNIKRAATKQEIAELIYKAVSAAGPCPAEPSFTTERTGKH